MKKVLAAFVVVLLACGAASAFDEYDFNCDGTGNMVLASPVVYSGNIYNGDLNPGTWDITVPDAGWPGTGDPGARWLHIWTTYYVYDPGAYVWTGTFEECDIQLFHTGVGSMRGICDMTFQVQDWNENGILDYDECMDGLSGAVIIIHEGTGAYAELCGQGTYSGYYLRSCDLPESDPDYMGDFVDFRMALWLDECGMSTDQTTWGAVKALFR
jgi:hypothetical protein